MRYNDSGARELAVLYWWLIPYWSNGPKAWKYKTFNARCEEVANKPTFKAALRTRPCIIPLDGWYEWTKAEDGGKQPYYMHLANNALIGAAGLWEPGINKETGEVLEACSMIVGREVNARGFCTHAAPAPWNPKQPNGSLEGWSLFSVVASAWRS